MPARAKGEGARTSLVFFQPLDDGESLAPLDACVAALPTRAARRAARRRYPAITQLAHTEAMEGRAKRQRAGRR